MVVNLNPELFFDMDDFFNEDLNRSTKEEVEITLELIDKIVQWDKKNKRLDVYKYQFMVDILEGRKILTDRNKFLARQNLKTAEKYGFRWGKPKE